MITNDYPPTSDTPSSVQHSRDEVTCYRPMTPSGSFLVWNSG